MAEGSLGSPEQTDDAVANTSAGSFQVASLKSSVHFISTAVRNMDEVGFWFVSPSRPSNSQLQEWASIVPAFVQWWIEEGQGKRDAVTAARVRAALARLHQTYSSVGPHVSPQQVRKELVADDMEVHDTKMECRVDISQQLNGKVIKIEEVTAGGAVQSVYPSRDPSTKEIAKVPPLDGLQSLAFQSGGDEQATLVSKARTQWLETSTKRKNKKFSSDMEKECDRDTEVRDDQYEEGKESIHELASEYAGHVKDVEVAENPTSFSEPCENPIVSEAVVSTAIAAATATACGLQRMQQRSNECHALLANEKMEDDLTQDTITTDEKSDTAMETMDSQAHEAILGLVHGPAHCPYNLLPSEKMQVGL